jgi:hypothetical protein
LSARFDFCDLGENYFAHVLAILSLTVPDGENFFFLIIADMCLHLDQRNTLIPYPLYTSEVRGGGFHGRMRKPIIDCIFVESVVSPCCFTEIEAPFRSRDKLFMAFDIRYCDRSGWNSEACTDKENLLLDNEQIAAIMKSMPGAEKRREISQSHEDGESDDSLISDSDDF